MAERRALLLAALALAVLAAVVYLLPAPIARAPRAAAVGVPTSPAVPDGQAAPAPLRLPAAVAAPAPEPRALPLRFRAGTDAELDRAFLQPDSRPFLEWLLGMYASVQACAQPRVRAQRPAAYWLYVDVDGEGRGRISFEVDHHPWMFQAWTQEEVQRLGPLWTGSAWTEEEADAFDECAGAYAGAHPDFPAPASWVGHRELAMWTRLPVWQAEMYRWAGD